MAAPSSCCSVISGTSVLCTEHRSAAGAVASGDGRSIGLTPSSASQTTPAPPTGDGVISTAAPPAAATGSSTAA
uniref:Uncharacterized protein n=1 Tax=Chromera velia CCMP2878 TaxID=1169474 RepID=A0A0G4GML9_9ALVE|eukprot:Cvel_22547.t1-p1 / transcript=Cvel_22547.t1 / gene=Cvel_22547 / organism=Chromera_velia_CCMP2878 / gene_product=hypothetical protein / transcript_product=hypothetical protein / location=Cvel_scaffold2226:25458-25676(+) / protein_length=73 / sequence_SO=supercontig / SO=protein_coding / is_pseudo=false